MDGSMDRLGGEEFTHPLEDSLGKGRGKLVRGDIDLEAMQDAFLRGSQKPAARVMRSSWSCRVKPSTVEISSSSARSSPFSVHLPNGHPSISCAVVEAPEGTVGQLPHPPEIPDFPSGIVGGIVERQPVGPQPMKVLMPKGLKGTSVRNRGQHVSEGWSGPAASAGKMRLDAPSVLSDVTERELPSSISGSFPPTDGLTSVGQGHLQTRVARGGFPEVVHRSKLKLMRLGKKKDVNVGQSVDHRGLFPLASDGIDSISKSCDSSFKDMDCVHAENTARVLAMSLPQVEEAQQEIRSMLSPAAIAALQNRGKVKAMAGMRHRDAHMLGNDDGSGDFRKDTAMDISAMDKAQFPTMPARVVERTGGGASKEGNEWGAGGEDQGDAPTISQTVATAVGGIGDKTTLEAALQTLPGGEQAKLAWTGRGDVRVETGRGTATELKSKLGTEEEVGTPTEPEGPRVDLRGEVVPEGAEVSSYEALYHHGEAPDRAGYTLTELVQLARSTVVGQRQVALRALAGVIRKRAKCISCNNKVDHAHLPEMLPLAIRMSLDEASASIVVCALDALEAWIIPLAQQVEEETFGRQGLCWVDHQVMPTPKVRPLSTPEEERCLPNPDSPNNTGGEEDEEMEMNNLAELCRNDPCQGMLKTALLTTLQRILNRYTLSRSILSRSIPLSGSGRQAPAVVGVSTEEGDSGGGGWGENIRARALPPQAALSCLKVLWAMARRSSDMAWNIVSEPGLLDSVREAFLEPCSDGNLPVHLCPSPPVGEKELDSGALSHVKTKGVGKEVTDAVDTGRLALWAIRLVRAVCQGSREAALRVSEGPLLESVKGFLALRQQQSLLHNPNKTKGEKQELQLPLSLVQTEVLELWRACLSYGIDVFAAETVTLLAQDQGWLLTRPTIHSGAEAADLTGDQGMDISFNLQAKHPQCSGQQKIPRAGYGSQPLPPPGSAGFLNAPHHHAPSPSPCLSLYRALHQLMRACVIPPSCGKEGEVGIKMTPSSPREGKESIRKDSALKAEAGASKVVMVSGVEVDPEALGLVGDVVDGAVEGAVEWLLVCCAGGAAMAKDLARGEARVLALQSAAIHLVACWMTHYKALSRSNRRDWSCLAALADDALAVSCALLASPLLPAALASAEIIPTTDRVQAQASTGQGTGGRGGWDAVQMVALDWLSGVFRLALACESSFPGEAASVLKKCSPGMIFSWDTVGQSARLLRGGTVQGDRSKSTGYTTEHMKEKVEESALCEDEVVAYWGVLDRALGLTRWLGCQLGRLVEADGNGGVGSEGYTVLQHQDNALQSVALCGRGDEAAVRSLITLGLSDLGYCTKDQSKGGVPVGLALLRKVFCNALCDATALSHSRDLLEGRWEALQTLRASPPAGAASLLPFPSHWLMLPLASQGGEQAASLVVSSCLATLIRLEREGSTYVSPSNLSPAVKLYHVANVCLYGAGVLAEEGAARDFDWLLSRYTKQCGSELEVSLTKVVAQMNISTSSQDPAKLLAAAQARVDGGVAEEKGEDNKDKHINGKEEQLLVDFVKDLTSNFLADSFGQAGFARVLRTFTRLRFPIAARHTIWKELGSVGLLPLLDNDAAPSDHEDQEIMSLADPFLYPPDLDTAMIDTYLSAVEHPRFSSTSQGFTRVVEYGRAVEPLVGAWGGKLHHATSMHTMAIHHLACYFFPPPRLPQTLPHCNDEVMGPGEEGWRPDFGQRKRFKRLLNIAVSSGRKGVAREVLEHECAGTGFDGYGYECLNSPSCTLLKQCVTVEVLKERRRQFVQTYIAVLGMEGEDECGIARKRTELLLEVMVPP